MDSLSVFSTDRQDMEWALNAMRLSETGFGGIPNVTDDMGIVKLRGLPFGCSKEEIIEFFNGKNHLYPTTIVCPTRKLLFIWVAVTVSREDE